MSDTPPASRPLDSALEAASILARNAAIFCLTLMAALIVVQVLGRNFFDLGMPWADELARFCGVAMVFLGAPILALRGQHVAVDLVREALPAPMKRVVLALGEASFLAFAGLALWSLHLFLARAGKFTTPTLGLSNWIFYAPAVIGFVLMTAISLARLATIFGGRAPRSGTPPQP